MPRLLPIPRPSVSGCGYEPSPIGPGYSRFYILDQAGRPMRVYDFGEHARWEQFEGKGWQIRDTLPELAVDVWTYFSGWASMKDEDPPKFLTHISGASQEIIFSLTWEEAMDQHRQVMERLALAMAK